MKDKKLPSLYPLRFKEVLRNYSFGDRWIVREFAKSGLPDGHRVGETWEVVDRPKDVSEIINGSLAGKTLHQAIAEYGADLLGRDIMARFEGRFPLLIKFLDATHTLGEQAHTNDELTKARGIDDFSGKTEAWYMVRTRPGATVLCGNKPGVTPETLLESLMNSDARSAMAEYPAKPHDAFLLYAGTMHYSRGGLLFYEIMQNSDVYVGLGPFGPDVTAEEKERRSRLAVEAVHLEEGFDCRPQPVTLTHGQNKQTFAIVCQHFAVERLDLSEPYVMAMDGRRFTVLTLIEGRARVVHPGSEDVVLQPGLSCLLPACLGKVRIEPDPTACILNGYVPDLLRDVIKPLRAKGIPDDAILALGGKTMLNPLNELLKK